MKSISTFVAMVAMVALVLGFSVSAHAVGDGTGCTPGNACVLMGGHPNNPNATVIGVATLTWNGRTITQGQYDDNYYYRVNVISNNDWIIGYFTPSGAMYTFSCSGSGCGQSI